MKKALTIFFCSVLALAVLLSVRQKSKLIHHAPHSYTSSRPVVPALAELVLDPIHKDRPTQASLRQRIQVLFEHHPDSEIRALVGLAKNKKIRIRLVESASRVNAVFTLERNDTSQPDSLDNLIPTFVFNSYWLAHFSTDQTLEAMMVLSHEFVHYKQWKNSQDVDRWVFVIEDSQVAKDLVFQSTTVSALCSEFWKLEDEAFSAQCHLAKKWRVIDEDQSLCRAFDSSEWNLALFAHQEGPPACKRIFAELAGHPNPSQFLPTPNEFE